MSGRGRLANWSVPRGAPVGSARWRRRSLAVVVPHTMAQDRLTTLQERKTAEGPVDWPAEARSVNDRLARGLFSRCDERRFGSHVSLPAGGSGCAGRATIEKVDDEFVSAKSSKPSSPGIGALVVWLNGLHDI